MTISQSTERIGHELLAVLPRLNRIVARELRGENDLTLVQIRVLAELSEGAISLSELAHKREVSLQAASEHVQCLVERGWVVRVPDPSDRRRFTLHITDEGRRRLNAVRDHIAYRFSSILERLTAEEASAIDTGLAALHRILADQE